VRDDDELLAALGEAIRAREAVPEWFLETGKNAYAWHNIDAELAQLTYDSDTDRDAVAAVRSETASIRALTFTSARLSIELEVGEGSLIGQIIPPRAGTLEVHTTAGVTSSPVDEIGCFAVAPIPNSPFRLRCRTEDGADVLTGWITLLFPLGSRGSAAQAAPRLTSDMAVACWTGSSASPSRTL
jgi:hypothetical protein